LLDHCYTIFQSIHGDETHLRHDFAPFFIEPVYVRSNVKDPVVLCIFSARLVVSWTRIAGVPVTRIVVSLSAAYETKISSTTVADQMVACKTIEYN
jgi:hypothetical protein